MKVILSFGARQAMLAASVEAHPKEALGYLVGEHVEAVNAWIVEAATVDQMVTKRTPNQVSRSEHTKSRMEELFGDRLLGSWHSHPDARAYISSGDPSSDLEGMDVDDVEIVVSVWPGKLQFCTRMKAYVKVSDSRVRRLILE